MNAREEILATLRTARDASQPGAPKDEVVRDYMCETDDAPGSRPVLDFFIEMLGDYHVAVHEVTADKIPSTRYSRRRKRPPLSSPLVWMPLGVRPQARGVRCASTPLRNPAPRRSSIRLSRS